MPVAESSLAPSEQIDCLAVFRHFAEEFAGVGVEDGCAYGHLHNLVLSVLAVGASRAAALAVRGEEVTVSFEDDMSSAAAVASVGTAFGYILGAVVMAAARTPFAAAAKYLYVVYEIRVGHNQLLDFLFSLLPQIGNGDLFFNVCAVPIVVESVCGRRVHSPGNDSGSS